MRSAWLFSALSVLLLFFGVPFVHAQETAPLKTAWLGEHETFVVWYAQKHGWDKEVGLDISLIHFRSGRELVDGVAAYEWDIAGCGAVPALTAALSNRLLIIAVANDESRSNVVFVRQNSPILSIKGNNATYPDIYGDSETLKNALLLCTKGSSGHYLLVAWLKTLGMKPEDVRIKFMEPAQSLGSFSNGFGDAIAVWAPFTYEAERLGFRPVASAEDCKARQPVVIVANRKFANQYPQRVEAFLRLYFRGITLIRKTPVEELIPEYRTFIKEWAGRELSEETALRDLQNHPVFTLKEQLELFDVSQGKSVLQQWLSDIATFQVNADPAGLKSIPGPKHLDIITDSFLKAIH